HRFGPGIAEGGPIHARELAHERGGLTSERRLGPDLETFVHALMQRFGDDLRRVAEEVRAEAVERVDVLVAVEVPEAAAARPGGDDWIDELFDVGFET